MAQIGTIKIQTQNGERTVPVFDLGDSGSNIYEYLRVRTPSGTGFIPLASLNDAAFSEIRTETQSGTLALHNETSLGASVEDFEDQSIHLNAISDATNWSGNTGTFSTSSSGAINGSYSLYQQLGGGTSERTITCSVPYRIGTLEWKHKWNTISTGSLGDGHELRVMDSSDYSNGTEFARHNINIDDTPEGDDQVTQPRINGNRLYHSQNTVYTYRIEFDWDNGTFDFYTNGSISYSNLSFNDTTFSGSCYIHLSGDADGNDWERWIDDVKITQY
jgi:hypothetical protein